MLEAQLAELTTDKRSNQVTLRAKVTFQVWEGFLEPTYDG